MGASGWHHFDVKRIKKETEKALLVSLEESGQLIWIPKSVIADVEDYKEGDKNLTMSIKDYWAQKVGLAP